MRLLISLLFIALLFLMVGLIFMALSRTDGEDVTLAVQTHPVTMYATLDCEPCDQKKKQFIVHNIAFKEETLDINVETRRAFEVMLAQKGYADEDLELPIFVINGQWITGNPDIEKLSEYW